MTTLKQLMTYEQEDFETPVPNKSSWGFISAARESKEKNEKQKNLAMNEVLMPDWREISTLCESR